MVGCSLSGDVLAGVVVMSAGLLTGRLVPDQAFVSWRLVFTVVSCCPMSFITAEPLVR